MKTPAIIGKEYQPKNSMYRYMLPTFVSRLQEVFKIMWNSKSLYQPQWMYILRRNSLPINLVNKNFWNPILNTFLIKINGTQAENDTIFLSIFRSFFNMVFSSSVPSFFESISFFDLSKDKSSIAVFKITRVLDTIDKYWDRISNWPLWFLVTVNSHNWKQSWSPLPKKSYNYLKVKRQKIIQQPIIIN